MVINRFCQAEKKAQKIAGKHICSIITKGDKLAQQKSDNM
jgi:hypothetical protein